MIFLIEYNRSEGKIVTFRNYDASHRREAQETRFGIELDLNRKGIKHEVVLLEAHTADELLRTHRRYFENLELIHKKKTFAYSSSQGKWLLCTNRQIPG